MEIQNPWKFLLLFSFVLGTAVSVTSCGDDDDEDLTPSKETTSGEQSGEGSQGEGLGVGQNTGETSVTGGVRTLYITGADVVGYVNVSDEVLVNTTFGFVYGTQSGVNVDNCLGKETSVSLEDKEYHVTLHNLESATQYYYRSYALIGRNYVYGAEKTFTTKCAAATALLTSQEGRTATFRCTTNLEDFDLQSTSIAYGLVWGTSANVDINSADGQDSASGLESGGAYTVSAKGLKYSTTYYYRAYTRTGSKYTYSESQSFTTEEGSAAGVDLGLPSGLKWATCNVGASSPEDYGDYFAWGETKSKKTYNWSTYKYSYASTHLFTKYCASTSNGYNGFVDNKTTLDPEDDVAHVKWGGAWRMPTKAEQDELRDTNNCTWTWTTQGGKNGYKVTSKKNGNSIFLPAAGFRNDSSLSGAGSWGHYWSSSLGTNYSDGSYRLYFYSGDVYSYYNGRDYGQSVRPVCP